MHVKMCVHAEKQLIWLLGELEPVQADGQETCHQGHAHGCPIPSRSAPGILKDPFSL